MRHLKKTFHCTLAVWGFGLISGWAQANVFLTGAAAGKPGDEVVFSIGVSAGTKLDAIDILPYYDDFAGILELVDLQGTSALTAGGIGMCEDGLCAYFYLPAKSFEKEAVLATFRFVVTDNAWDFVDPNSHGRVAFDLGVYLDGDHMLFPQGQVFTVLAVPEPSTFSLTALAVLLLVASRYWRQPHSRVR